MRILITGAGGFLGWEMIRQMKLQPGFEIIAASSNPQRLKGDCNYQDVALILNDKMWKDEILMKSIDVLIHTAFCRKSDGQRLMESLLFSKKLFNRAVQCGIGGILNISSQSIYGSEKDGLPDESGTYAPGYLYALAKSASELLLEACAEDTKTSFTNIRLASLVGLSKYVPDNVVYKFVERVLKNEDLSIQGGQQNFSFIDVRDAAEAIIRLLNISYRKWDRFYNLGPEKQTNIVDLAKSVCDYAKSIGKKSSYMIHKDDILLNTGMDSKRLYQTIGWKPCWNMDDIIQTTADYITGKGV